MTSIKGSASVLLTTAFAVFSSPNFALAGGHGTSWTLDGANSTIAFGSVKLDDIAEVHKFDGLSGSVSDDGAVSIEIDLTSVNTAIDIRNERMIEHLFKNIATATLTADIDMPALEKLAIGGMTDFEVDGELSFLGQEVPLTVNMFATRIGEGTVMVTTSDFVFLSTDELGVNAGVDKLKELAGLDSITRATPIILRFVFNADDKKA